jgi:Collagen triple helix repeat (20 copies)
MNDPTEGQEGYEGDEGQEGNEGNEGDEGQEGDEGEEGRKGNKGDEDVQGTEGNEGNVYVGDEGNEGNEGNEGDATGGGNNGDEGTEGDEGNEGSFEGTEPIHRVFLHQSRRDQVAEVLERYTRNTRRHEKPTCEEFARAGREGNADASTSGDISTESNSHDGSSKAGDGAPVYDDHAAEWFILNNFPAQFTFAQYC